MRSRVSPEIFGCSAQWQGKPAKVASVEPPCDRLPVYQDVALASFQPLVFAFP
jgi:hypothetical protein